MKKILLLFLLIISTSSFSMEESYLPSERQPIYTKAMVSSESGEHILSCCPQAFKRYGENVDIGIKQKDIGTEDYHMSLQKLEPYKGNMQPGNKAITGSLTTVMNEFEGKKFSVTGIGTDFGNHVAAIVEPTSPLPEGILPENPHVSLLRHGNPDVREEFMRSVDSNKLKSRPITFDAVTVEGEKIKIFQDFNKRNHPIVEKKTPFQVTVHKDDLNK